MEFDSKQKLLLAIYTEYQKDVPNMKSITAQVLGMDHVVFKSAAKKLANEELVNGILLSGETTSGVPVMVDLKLAQMSPQGLAYIESKLGIANTESASVKVGMVQTTVQKLGLDMLTDFAAKVAAEMLKTQLK